MNVTDVAWRENGVVNETSANFTSNSTVDIRNEELAKLELAILSTIFALAVTGNSILLLSLVSRWKKLSRMQLFIVHLSLADLFVAFCNVLPQFLWDLTYRFHGTDGLCKVVKLVQVLAVYASAYVLVLTAIDRYYAICRPLTSHLWTPRRVHSMVCVAWMTSLVFSMPQVFLFSYVEISPGKGIYDCWATFEPPWMLQVYVTWFTTSVFFVPVSILVVTYSFVCFHVWTRGRLVSSKTIAGFHPSPRPSSRSGRFGFGGQHQNSNGSHLFKSLCPSKDGGSKINIINKSGLSKSKIRTFKLTFTVILCFIVCWSPFFVSQMWSAFDPAAPFTGKSCLDVFT